MELTDDELRVCQLANLDQIIAFCDAEGIRYFLTYGTLLGAVRHRGYIPWDDDIDLMMPRSDYLRFCATFTSSDPNYRVQSPETSEHWPFPYAKVHDLRTNVKEAIDVDHCFGVNVDVFPIDHYAPRGVRRWHQLTGVRLRTTVLTLRLMQVRAGRHRLKAAFLRVTKLVVRRWDAAELAKSVSKAASAGGTSSRTGILVGSCLWGVHSHALEGFVFAEFEGRSCRVPRGYSDVLTAMYGPDYMQWPPEDKRKTHHRFVASWA